MRSHSRWAVFGWDAQFAPDSSLKAKTLDLSAGIGVFFSHVPFANAKKSSPGFTLVSSPAISKPQLPYSGLLAASRPTAIASVSAAAMETPQKETWARIIRAFATSAGHRFFRRVGGRYCVIPTSESIQAYSNAVSRRRSYRPEAPPCPAGSILIFSSVGFLSVFMVRSLATYLAGS